MLKKLSPNGFRVAGGAVESDIQNWQVVEKVPRM